ncbi:hypothetical protein Tco_0736181 [Tanacetum coccineum]
MLLDVNENDSIDPKSRKGCARLKREGADRRDDRQWFYKGNIGHLSAHDVYLKIKIIGVQMITVDKRYGYRYLKEIVVKRVDQKEYKFAETDFPRLNQNDIEDLYLLKIQDKTHNIDGVDEFDLVNDLQLYIRRIVIKKRVEDARLGVESYQTKLNMTKPQFMTGCLHQKVSYTTMSHPQGVVHLGNDNQKNAYES